MNYSLNAQIFLGAFIGVAVGILLNITGAATPVYEPAIYVCDIAGGIFVNLLKMILIPLVFASITVGIANLRAHAQMGLVWKTTLLYFISTTALSVLLGMLVVNIFRPGVGLEVALFQDAMATFNADSMNVSQFIKSFLANIFVNPFQAMAEGQVLPTVIFALMLGIALVIAGDQKAAGILGLMNEFFSLIMMMVDWIMKIAPIGIMALLAKLVATQDVALLTALGKFMGVVIGATIVHGLITLPTLLFIITKTSPLTFFKGVREALVTAFSTSSSSATLPVTIRCVEEHLKVDKDVAGFVLPLGATINMDGTALYEAVAALFVANIMGVVIGATIVHGLITLPTLLFIITKTSPLTFFKGVREALVTAFSTSSSSATLPVTIRCVEEHLKVDKDVAGFVLPLGATINMDGTALYEAVAALFVANIMGIDLNIVQQLIIFLTAIIAAIGAPGIPSAGMVTMIMVLQAVNLPVEAIAILLPIDRILDAVRTTINVEGDAVGSMVVHKMATRK